MLMSIRFDKKKKWFKIPGVSKMILTIPSAKY